MLDFVVSMVAVGLILDLCMTSASRSNGSCKLRIGLRDRRRGVVASLPSKQNRSKRFIMPSVHASPCLHLAKRLYTLPWTTCSTNSKAADE